MLVAKWHPGCGRIGGYAVKPPESPALRDGINPVAVVRIESHLNNGSTQVVGAEIAPVSLRDDCFEVVPGFKSRLPRPGIRDGEPIGDSHLIVCDLKAIETDLSRRIGRADRPYHEIVRIPSVRKPGLCLAGAKAGSELR